MLLFLLKLKKETRVNYCNDGNDPIENLEFYEKHSNKIINKSEIPVN